MNCPKCQKQEMGKAVFNGVEVDFCPVCLGLWFDSDELRQAKDERLKGLNWLDVDLWQDKAKFKVSQGKLLCPKCQVPLYEVSYGDSPVKVDLCNLCKGVFLERGEFKNLIDYLAKKGKREMAVRYWQNLAKEGLELFTGPEDFESEVADFLTVLSLLNAKFASQHPVITQLILTLPK